MKPNEDFSIIIDDDFKEVKIKFKDKDKERETVQVKYIRKFLGAAEDITYTYPSYEKPRNVKMQQVLLTATENHFDKIVISLNSYNYPRSQAYGDGYIVVNKKTNAGSWVRIKYKGFEIQNTIVSCYFNIKSL